LLDNFPLFITEENVVFWKKYEKPELYYNDFREMKKVRNRILKEIIKFEKLKPSQKYLKVLQAESLDFLNHILGVLANREFEIREENVKKEDLDFVF
jgi:hypothetical protein